jgi:hypothetical protein
MFWTKHAEFRIPFRLDSRPPDLVFVAIPLDFVGGGFGFRSLNLEKNRKRRLQSACPISMTRLDLNPQCFRMGVAPVKRIAF